MEIATAVLGPLIGVLIGAWLARRQGEADWLRARRADLYVELMDVLNKMLSLAAVDRRTIKYSTDVPPDIEQEVTQRWRDLVEHYKWLMTHVQILGGKMTAAFHFNGGTLLENLNGVYD